MEVQETDRMVIAKPVASRPSLSNFRSFSALLSGAISATPPCAFSETTVSAVRPKTVRFKPTVSRSSIEAVSSLGEISGTEVCYLSDKVVVPESKSTVVYKPLAKLVSSKTVHFLANLGNFNITNQQTAATRVQPQLTSNLHRTLPPQMKTNQTIESLKMASQNMEDNRRALSSTTSGDQPSYDGYNWRKYGQKQVKGSEYPRSYYKCTYPNCAVKKKVERSLDGQIAEIVYKGEHNHSKPQLLVYKGEHNHSKPQLLKRQCSGSQEQGFVSDGISQELGNPSGSNRVNERKEGSKGRKENKNEVGLLVNPSYTGKAQIPNNPIRTCNGVGTPDNSGGLSGDCEEAGRGVDADDDEPKIKRRKNGHQSNEVGLLGQDVREPHIVVQNSTDSEILGDGFRWRKYGQKVVKGNPYPRSYYRCTNLKCNVRKHVERALDDPRAFISTYEGKHNHEMPTNLNLGASDPDSVTPTNKAKR